MRILINAPFPPNWCATSYRRALNFALQLSKEYDVEFLAPEISKKQFKDINLDVIYSKWLKLPRGFETIFDSFSRTAKSFKENFDYTYCFKQRLHSMTGLANKICRNKVYSGHR